MMKHLGYFSAPPIRNVRVLKALPLHHQNEPNGHRKLRHIEESLGKALHSLDQAYQFDTKEELVAKYEVVEDLSFALRRGKTFTELDPLEIACINRPDLPECKVFDL